MRINLMKQHIHPTSALQARRLCLAAALAVLNVAAGAWPTAATSSAAPHGDLRGKIVDVDDGDTVVLLTASNDQVKIRLASIDAPESSHTNKESGRIGQPFSENSKRHLEQLVKGKTVDAKCPDVDRYGRTVCELFVNGASANVDMVRSGWAWANMASHGRYLRDRSLVQLQEGAQKARAGLWAGSKPIAPWEWRRECWEQGNCPN